MRLCGWQVQKGKGCRWEGGGGLGRCWRLSQNINPWGFPQVPQHTAVSISLWKHNQRSIFKHFMLLNVFPSDQQAVKDVSVHLQAGLTQEATGAACCWRMHKRIQREGTRPEQSRHLAAAPQHVGRDNICCYGCIFEGWWWIWPPGTSCSVISPRGLKVTPRVFFPLVLSGRLSKAMVKWRQVSFLFFKRPGWQHQESFFVCSGLLMEKAFVTQTDSAAFLSSS